MGKHRHHEHRPYYQRHPYRIAFMALTAIMLIGVLVTHLLPPEWSMTVGVAVGTAINFIEKVEE